jgi:hypothetical protein
MIRDGKVYCDECGKDFRRSGSARALAGKLLCDDCYYLVDGFLWKGLPEGNWSERLQFHEKLARFLIVANWLLIVIYPLFALAVGVHTHSVPLGLLTLFGRIGPLTSIVLLLAAREFFESRRSQVFHGGR